MRQIPPRALLTAAGAAPLVSASYAWAERNEHMPTAGATTQNMFRRIRQLGGGRDTGSARTVLPATNIHGRRSVATNRAVPLSRTTYAAGRRVHARPRDAAEARIRRAVDRAPGVAIAVRPSDAGGISQAGRL